jgi:hypothetical protein
VEFRVLGPLEVRAGQEPLPLGPRKQRALLARLLVDAGRTVSVERLLDDLWGEDVPGTAVKMVQIYVSGLRKALGSGRLLTRASGYCLEPAGDDDLDLERFERLAASGRAAHADGDPARAAALPPGGPIEAVGLRNPLSQEASQMRRHPLEGILGAVGVNLRRQQPNVRLFEIAPVFNWGSSGAPQAPQRAARGPPAQPWCPSRNWTTLFIRCRGPARA